MPVDLKHRRVDFAAEPLRDYCSVERLRQFERVGLGRGLFNCTISVNVGRLSISCGNAGRRRQLDILDHKRNSCNYIPFNGDISTTPDLDCGP